jgi:hypothetical protein
VQNIADGKLYAVAVDGSGVRQVATHFSWHTLPDSAVAHPTWGTVKASFRP